MKQILNVCLFTVKQYNCNSLNALFLQSDCSVFTKKKHGSVMYVEDRKKNNKNKKTIQKYTINTNMNHTKSTHTCIWVISQNREL